MKLDFILFFCRLQRTEESGSHVLSELSASNTLHDGGVQKSCHRVRFGLIMIFMDVFLHYHNKVNNVLFHRLKLSNGKKNCVSEALQMLFHDLESGKPGSATTYRVTNALEIRNGEFMITVINCTIVHV